MDQHAYDFLQVIARFLMGSINLGRVLFHEHSWAFASEWQI